MGAEFSEYRPPRYQTHESEEEYRAWRASRSHAQTKKVKRNHLYLNRAFRVSRDDFLYQYFRRPDFFEGLKNVSFKGQTTVPHYLEMMGYHKNGFETILGEMEGTLVKVTHRMHLPASEYGDRPMYMQELNPEDKRLFNDTTWYHVNQDITNTARNASPKEE